MFPTLERSTIDQFENDFFTKTSTDWWNNKKWKSLASTSKLIEPYVFVKVQENYPDKPLTALRVLEVGCGGGFLTERLARVGYNLTAIDINDELIQIAKSHAELDPTLPKIKYLVESVEQHCKNNFQQYDMVISNFVLEHVSDHDYFIKCCTNCVKSNGLLFISALSKSLFNWFCTIILFENVLGIIPAGTHDYEKLICAPDTERFIKSYNFSIRETKGIGYNVMTKNSFFLPTTILAYVVYASKNSS